MDAATLRPGRVRSAESERQWSWLVVGAIALMLTYFAITNHVDLAPWNNLEAAGPQLASTLSGVIPFSIIALGFALRIPLLMLVGTVYSYVWLLLQIRQWWIPYLFGSTPLHRAFDWYTAHGYDQTVRFLPVIEGRPVPDAQHVVLELLSLLVVIVTTVAYVRLRRERYS
ncbi:hypothetical protein [Sphaerobacter thermophilus]|jgi:hypothetical protein|uniref:Uncharacterized protein n=1 Tax=Sphaerobacter thermophilus (strain ATCC 49802 / DSM 20745 / KCCM 41009 / NCIMB 13125 / S 6022) TaxID=479434 RepID=D1C9U1_SPHTD|nr:hypothetical protein [Sphaerobacter thermophilus]ACZ40584.1 hypothetical protein Sthe_3184 [Sphaerobacter thermophilus DSM 20745]